MASKLEALLAQMVEDGNRRAQIPQKRKIGGGLHINLTYHAKGATLVLSRDNVHPSAKEWETVLKHFPYHVGKIEPTVTVYEGRKALRAELPIRQEAALKLL